MKFLVDESLSHRVAEILRTAGHDAAHVADLDLRGRPDEHVLAACEPDRILVTADTDFPTLAAILGLRAPSILLLRGGSHDAEARANSVMAAADACATALQDGAVVTVVPGRLRVRHLPI